MGGCTTTSVRRQGISCAFASDSSERCWRAEGVMFRFLRVDQHSGSPEVVPFTGLDRPGGLASSILRKAPRGGTRSEHRPTGSCPRERCAPSSGWRAFHRANCSHDHDRSAAPCRPTSNHRWARTSSAATEMNASACAEIVMLSAQPEHTDAAATASRGLVHGQTLGPVFCCSAAADGGCPVGADTLSADLPSDISPSAMTATAGRSPA